MSGGPVPPMIHNKRHVTSGPYPNDRRAQHQQHQHQHQQQYQQQQQQQPQQQQQQQQQQHEHLSNNESNNNNNNNTNTQNNHSNNNNNNNGYNNRGWKRPCMFPFNKYPNFIFEYKGQKPDGSASAPATLEIRKIPVESNTISKLNEHFSKFGTVTNVQVYPTFVMSIKQDRKFLFIRLLMMDHLIQLLLHMQHYMKLKEHIKILNHYLTIVLLKSFGITAIK